MNGIVLFKIYDKPDDFNFEIVTGYLHMCTRMDLL